METRVAKVVDRIDWQLLNDQRLMLAEIMATAFAELLDPQQTDALDGILNMLDDLCDANGISNGDVDDEP